MRNVNNQAEWSPSLIYIVLYTALHSFILTACATKIYIYISIYIYIYIHIYIHIYIYIHTYIYIYIYICMCVCVCVCVYVHIYIYGWWLFNLYNLNNSKWGSYKGITVIELGSESGNLTKVGLTNIEQFKHLKNDWKFCILDVIFLPLA